MSVVVCTDLLAVITVVPSHAFCARNMIFKRNVCCEFGGAGGHIGKEEKIMENLVMPPPALNQID